jgi:hypothetical protein
MERVTVFAVVVTVPKREVAVAEAEDTIDIVVAPDREERKGKVVLNV